MDPLPLLGIPLISFPLDPLPVSQVACKVTHKGDAWAYSTMRGAKEVVRGALEGEKARDVIQACGPGADPAHIVDHPVLLLHRYDTTNAYHNIEDVLAVFTTLAMINSSAIRDSGVQVGGWDTSIFTLPGWVDGAPAYPYFQGGWMVSTLPGWVDGAPEYPHFQGGWMGHRHIHTSRGAGPAPLPGGYESSFTCQRKIGRREGMHARAGGALWAAHLGTGHKHLILSYLSASTDNWVCLKFARIPCTGVDFRREGAGLLP